MEFFQQLERLVLSRWKCASYDTLALPEIARQAMVDLPPSAHVSPTDILRWVLESTHLPPQFDPEGTFGQPPVTLSSPGRLVIQALYWVDGTTAIHQHSFSGAFHVLSGSSVHAEYDFKCEDRVNAHLLLGDVHLRRAELLRKGDVRAIVGGQQFIHALFHLDRPSVTIVVRTPNDPEQGPQYSYYKPFIARDAFHRESDLGRRLQVLTLLSTLSDSVYVPTLRALLENDTFYTALSVLHHCFDKNIPEAELWSLLDVARRKHGERAERLFPVFREMVRQVRIIRRRRLVTAADHRFFLALVLNLSERQRILSMVNDRYPGDSPIDIVLRWADEMARLPAGGEGEGPNPLGLHWGDEQREALRAVLENQGSAVAKPLLEKLESSPILGALCTKAV